MFTFQRASDLLIRGTWTPMQVPGYSRSAFITCPLCGKVGSLLDHEIADDGTVQPSVVCPDDACRFHEHIKLEDWR